MGGGAHGARRRDLHAVDGHHRAHAVQSGDRRHGQGASRSRDRRARRLDGHGDRRDRRSSSSCSIAAAAPRSGRRARRPTSGVYSAWVRAALEREPGISWIIGKAGTDSRRGRPRRRPGDGGRRHAIAATRWSSRPARSSTAWCTSGRDQRPSGRAGEPPSRDLAESLKSFGFSWGRLKTGTPPRLHRRSIDFSRVRRGARRRPAGAVLVPERRDRSSADRLSSRPHDRARARARARAHRASRRSSTARSPASVRATARRSRTR